jgi:hypothetical protein
MNWEEVASFLLTWQGVAGTAFAGAGLVILIRQQRESRRRSREESRRERLDAARAVQLEFVSFLKEHLMEAETLEREVFSEDILPAWRELGMPRMRCFKGYKLRVENTGNETIHASVIGAGFLKPPRQHESSPFFEAVELDKLLPGVPVEVELHCEGCQFEYKRPVALAMFKLRGRAFFIYDDGEVGEIGDSETPVRTRFRMLLTRVRKSRPIDSGHARSKLLAYAEPLASVKLYVDWKESVTAPWSGRPKSHRRRFH